MFRLILALGSTSFGVLESMKESCKSNSNYPLTIPTSMCGATVGNSQSVLR